MGQGVLELKGLVWLRMQEDKEMEMMLFDNELHLALIQDLL